MTSPSRPERKRRRIAVAAVSAVGAALAWQIVVQAASERMPANAALNLAPGSARLLALAAEAELEAGRIEAAEALARQALRAEPLNVRALRVLGVAAGRRGAVERADELVTQAGNWSLRDGPAHAWLIERRLRQGDYASAFAHADALMRRSPDVHPQLFELMTTAIAADRRALGPIAERLALQPSWREPFIHALAAAPGGAEGAATLAVMLQPGRTPFSDAELGALLTRLVDAGQLRAAADLRRRLRPTGWATPFDGEFDDRPGPAPFRWRIVAGAGASVEIAPDDVAPNQSALRVEYDGYSTPGLINQLIVLPAGAYELSGRWRSETPLPDGRLAWTVTCAQGGAAIGEAKQPAAAGETPWRPFAARFVVPSGCEGQWLHLKPLSGDRRTTLVVWYDGLNIRPSAAAGGK